LESLREIVGLEVMAECVRAGTYLDSRMGEFQIAGAASLKLQMPNEVRTTETESRMVLDNRVFYM